MKTIKETLIYMFKNFGRLLPLFIIPSVLMALFVDPTKTFILFRDIAQGGDFTLAQIYRSLSFVFSVSWIWGILAIVVMAIFAGVIFAMINRHFKIGVFSYKKFFTCLDETILFVLPITIVCMGIYELLVLLASCLMFSFALIIPDVGLLYVDIAIYVVTVILALTLFTAIIHLIPAKLELGYKFSDAFSVSVKGIRGHKFHYSLIMVIPIIIFVGLMVVSRFLFPQFFYGIAIVCYILFLMFAFSFVMVSYAMLYDVDRKDIKKKLFD